MTLIHGYDRWITSEPWDCGLDNYGEGVYERLTDEADADMVAANFDGSDQENKWLNKMFDKGLDWQQAANLLIRLFYRYIKAK